MTEGLYFSAKSAARKTVWDRLEAEGAAQFPFPPHGRIPNFTGAREAAVRLLDSPAFDGIRRIKANPDAPQAPLRSLALERGIEIYMPTPRLKGGFKRLDPKRVPREHIREAITIAHVDEYAEEVPLERLPPMDLIVAGSVAVTRRGDRCGKGEGYSDLEFAILRELGLPICPVVTTVHALQIVEFFPVYDHDIGLSWIATPDELIQIERPGLPPRGIDWERLSPEQLREMPILQALKSRRS